MTPATSTSRGTRRSLDPLPLTRSHRPRCPHQPRRGRAPRRHEARKRPSIPQWPGPATSAGSQPTQRLRHRRAHEGAAGVLEAARLIAVSAGGPRERAGRCAHRRRAFSPPCLSAPGSWHRDHASSETRTVPRSPPDDGSPSPAHSHRHVGHPCARHWDRDGRAPSLVGRRPDSAAGHRCSLRRDRSPRSPTNGRTPATRSHRREPSAASSSDQPSSSGTRSPTRTG